MKFIKTFDKICKKDVTSAGGKGASLGEMTQAKISVPEGFVILSQTFDKFVQETAIKSEIDSILKKVNIEDINSVNNASEKTKYLILNAQLPTSISGEILESFKVLNSKFVAVRSSATSEDSEDAAWAGQLDTFLNTTKENLLKNIKECWASLFTPRAIFYRFEKKLEETKISVAVVVQKMIQSEISGVAFSVHPVTQNKNQILIEAGLGLGEAVVSGTITPDSYVIKKDSLEIEEININKQTKKLEKKGDRNVWVETKEEGEKKFLDDKKIDELTKLIIQIENHYGFPCDIEWAYEKGKFYITQSTPITTLDGEVGKISNEYKKVVTRDYPLIWLEIEDKAVREGFRKISNGEMFHMTALVYKKGKGVGFYYNFTDKKKESPETLIKHLNKNPSKFDKLVKEYPINRKRLLHLCSKPNIKNLSEIYNLAIKISISLGIFTLISRSKSKEIDPRLIKEGAKLREATDKTLYFVGASLVEIIRNNVPKKYKKYSKFLTFKEVNDKKLPPILELKKREQGFIFYNNKLYLETKEKFSEKENLWFNDKEENDKNISGQIGFIGKVRGIAKIVFEESEIQKVKTGDILVSPMTTPNFLPAIKKAKAIVTDEGGVTCHAVIVSREMKIPCIVGTNNATGILKDGDLIEVDAKKGIVKILKKLALRELR